MAFFDDYDDIEDEQPRQLNTFANLLPDIYPYYPTFSYKYIKTDDSKHSFLNSACEVTDYHRYFLAAKQISRETIKDWESKPYGKNYNFKIEAITRNQQLLELLKDSLGKDKLDIEQIPIFVHFHLSVREDKMNKPTVIHSIIGEYGEFCIIAFDLFHEIHKQKS